MTSAKTTGYGTIRKELSEKEADKEWIEAVTHSFERIAGEDKQISFEEFKKELNLSDNYFADRYFKFFDQDGSGHISIEEFNSTLRKTTAQTDIEKLRFLFDIFDTNGDGTVSLEELKVVLGACVTESALSLSDEQMNQLVAALLKAADKDDDGVITYEELAEQLQKYPGLIDNLSISPSNWIKRQSKKKGPAKKPTLPKYLQLTYVRNNLPTFVFLVVFLLLNVVCFSISAYRYRDSNVFVVIARGCGMALNLDCALVVVFMLRRTLSFIRNTPIGKYLPIDESIEIHKFIGYTIAFWSVLHTAMHLGNIGYVVTKENAKWAFWEYLLTARPGIGWIDPGLGYITGDVLIVVLLIMVVFSLSIVRANGYFQLFYWTHCLYWVFLIFLILHGPIFWYFFLVPGLLFLTEKLWSVVVFFRQMRSSKCYIEEVNLLPSKVTHLVISRPSSFTYLAGDYVFIQIPDLAAFEWHPFSISSAPEVEGEIWLHIRSLGNWTNNLYNFYKDGTKMDKNKVCPLTDVEMPRILDKKSSRDLARPRDSKGTHIDHRKVFIDGPYGTPVQELSEVDHAILIAAGIGVTPFASVLQHLLNEKRRTNTLNENFRVKKVDFIWVNRSMKEFEWFLTLLTQLELEESRGQEFDRFLDMHLFITSAKSKTDLKGICLQMALELIHQNEERDLLTGLKTRTQPGRPDWNKLFKQFKAENHGKRIQVFFCGSPALAKILKTLCDQVEFRFVDCF